MLGEYAYDVFGVLSDGLAHSALASYASSTYDSVMRQYDYGFRDYDPGQGRFTTLDPIRDGWYTLYIRVQCIPFSFANAKLIKLKTSAIHGAYCNNDPVNFVDMWGLEVVSISNRRISSLVNDLYEKSETFKGLFDKLLASKNGEGDRLVVMFTADSSDYAGTTQTKKTVSTGEATTFTLNSEGEIVQSKLKKGEAIQSIVINLDFDRIDSKKLPVVSVIAEEVAHAAEAAAIGADAYNKEILLEQTTPYKLRLQEMRAKSLATEVVCEYNN